ncbi:TonB-dependent receptor [Mucilaginibacter gynuensis]|uniref:TonB-dependent receptor n=2 Tax=Mucilaginibacter gynuensis TaxID=1302236 RepID=A0ABP8G9J9_9SPHI
MLIFSLAFNMVRAQSSYNIKGNITDSTTTPLEGANIRLVLGTDTLKFTSNNKGEFTINGIKRPAFQIMVSYLGYFDFAKNITIPDNNTELTLPAIVLQVDTSNLNEVVIKSKTRPIVLKKDTIEYNVGSYRGSNEEMIQELLKRLPGLRVDKDGNLTSGGKPVTKLRINGRDFFTGNVKEFIKQLPAGIFTKVQIVNDYGRDADFTGIKKDYTQTLNLVTKPGMDNGVFGSLSASAGTNRQLGGGIGANYWKAMKQLSASGEVRTMKNAVGSNNYKSWGLTFGNDIAKKLNLSSSYRYNNSSGSAQNNTYSESISSIGKINNDVNSIMANSSSQHNFSTNLTYNPDKKTYINFGANLSLAKSTNSLFSDAQQTGIIKQGLVTNSLGINKTPNMGINLTVGRSLDTNNRLTVNLQFGQNPAKSTQRIDRNIRYYDTLGNFKKDSVFNSLLTNNGRSQNLSAGITYTAILTKKANLDVIYNINQNKQRNDLQTDLIEPPNGLSKIDSLSNNNHNTVTNNQLGINYRWEGTKLRTTIGINAQRNAQSGLYEGRTEKVSNATFNLSPVFNLSYSPSTKDQFEIGYYGYNQPPAIDQLQPVRDTRNLQNVIIGNPNLKSAFNHSINSNFRHVNPENQQMISFGLNTSFTQNQILSNTIIEKDTLNSLRQVTTFINAGGSNNTSGNYSWNIPIKIGKTKLNTELGGWVGFSRQVVYTDNVKSYNNSRNITQSVRAMLNLTKFSSEVNVTYSQSFNHYVVGQGLTSKISQWTINASQRLNLSENTSMDMNISKTFLHGYTNINTNNPFIVNASASQQFFKHKLNISIQASDIFNQTNQVGQYTNGNSIVTSRSNFITRIVLISCSYSINNFGIL